MRKSEYQSIEEMKIRYKKVCCKNESFYIVTPFVLSYHYFGVMTEGVGLADEPRRGRECIFQHGCHLSGVVCLVHKA